MFLKKKHFVLVAFLALFSADVLASQFCSGFERGYITGYKQATGSTLDPLTPLCPLQPLKRLSDPESDFEHGYVIGLRMGMAAGSRR